MKRRYRTPRSQPRVSGELKIPTPSSLPPVLRGCIERDSARWGASRSWIIVSVLATFYGVEVATVQMGKR